MDVFGDDRSSRELLTLTRMAARLKVPPRWLRERAKAGEVPGLQAGDRWLFRPDVVFPVVAEMAAGTRDATVTRLIDQAGTAGFDLRRATELTGEVSQREADNE